MKLSKNLLSETTRERIWLLAILALAVGLKAWLIVGQFIPFNSDEAVVALMARHILQGARPIFFYGQAYMGSLDAYLVAAGFALFGQQVWVIRLVQSLLYLGALVVTFFLGKEAFGSRTVGLMAASLMAIPVINVTLYTTASLGGYGEAMLIGSLVLWLGMRIGRSLLEGRTPGPLWRWLLLGFLAGLGLWAFGFSIVFSLPAAVYLIFLVFRVNNEQPKDELNEPLKGEPPKEEPQEAGQTPPVPAGRPAWLRRAGTRLQQAVKLAGVANLVALVGVLLGAAPLIGYALQNGFAVMLQELGGSAIAGVEKLPWIFEVGSHLLSLMVLGTTVIFGLRPPWGVEWLGLPLLPFVMIFWSVVIVYSWRCLTNPGPNRAPQALLVGMTVVLTGGFLFTPFGADPSGRYFLPLAIPMALFAGSLILQLEERLGKWTPGLLALLLVYNLWGTLQCAYRYPPGITTQFYTPAQVDHRYMPQLEDFLRQQGETRGYANYWISYPLAFHSQEELIFVPRLPYHQDFRYTEREDRYPPYGEQVAAAPRAAYITSNNPPLDERLRSAFTGLGVGWKEIQIGDYLVFYALSRPVRPQEIGLGENFP